MSRVGGRKWCEEVTARCEGEVLLDQKGRSVIQVGFDAGNTIWSHALFLDGRLSVWQTGLTQQYDLSAVVPPQPWLAERPETDLLLDTASFGINGQRERLLCAEVRRMFRELPRLPNAVLDVLFKFTTGPFGAFDLYYRLRHGQVNLTVNPPRIRPMPDIVVSLWFGHCLGALLGERTVLEALERGRVIRGPFQHLMLLAGIVESEPHRSVLETRRELYLALARHGDLLGAPALRAAGRAAASGVGE